MNDLEVTPEYYQKEAIRSLNKWVPLRLALLRDMNNDNRQDTIRRWLSHDSFPRIYDPQAAKTSGFSDARCFADWVVALTDTVAALATLPGGITIFGQHYGIDMHIPSYAEVVDETAGIIWGKR